MMPVLACMGAILAEISTTKRRVEEGTEISMIDVTCDMPGKIGAHLPYGDHLIGQGGQDQDQDRDRDQGPDPGLQGPDPGLVIVPMVVRAIVIRGITPESLSCTWMSRRGSDIEMKTISGRGSETFPSPTGRWSSGD
mmetsp:Transcript_24201/g.54399  ORF Transcript_24201/g.54399 Transcript_24201/m.54399 type:complete len:137 (-) Transcript_24201:2688-3098(-)